MLDLAQGIDILSPVAVTRFNSRFELRISPDEAAIYAQSGTDPDLKILIATEEELQSGRWATISDRVEYICDRYVNDAVHVAS